MPLEFVSLRINGDPFGGGPLTAGISETVIVLDDDAFLQPDTTDTGNQFSIGGTNFTSSAYPGFSGSGVEIYTATVAGQTVTFGYLTSAGDGVDDAIDRLVVLSGTINPGDSITGITLTSTNTNINYEDDIPSTVCFTPGTLIATPRGPVLIEDLQVGDLVITADNGLQAIRWIGTKHITGARLLAHPHLRPIRIKAHAFGHNKPERDLFVSPQHRMHLRSKRAQVLFGEAEILAPAKGLLNDKSILIDYQSKHVDYIHILFDNHELVLANGTWSESFHPGEYGINAIEKPQLAELFEVFPELRTDPKDFAPSSRQSLSVHEINVLLNNAHSGSGK